MNNSEDLFDVIIIGGGPAGMAAALGARAADADKILVLERDALPGGILNQCIHDGFGLSRYGESLSGPEYSERMIEEIHAEGICIETHAMALDLSPELDIQVNSPRAYKSLKSRSVVLAMGCRERTIGMLGIPGCRPAGIYTAGCAQNLVNLQNLRIGNRIVILGSGDIGLIMARRLTIEGMKVLGVYEIQDFCGGLDRNVRECLYDFGIALHLRSTIVRIRGQNRLESVIVADVDDEGRALPESRREIPCDTLLLSVGLIPENELSKKAGVQLSPVSGGAVVDDLLMTSVPGIFSAGNVLHIHDIADLASNEAYRAGMNAAEYSRSGAQRTAFLKTVPSEGIQYCVPQRLRSGCTELELSFRVERPIRDKSVIARGSRSGRLMAQMHYAHLMPSEMAKLCVKGRIEEDIEVLCNG